MLQKISPRPNAPKQRKLAAERELKRLERDREALKRIFKRVEKSFQGAATKRARRGKWDRDSQLILIGEVSLLRRGGLSERQAIKRTASDPEKLALFPYSQQRGKHDPKHDSQSRIAAALRQQLQRIKTSKDLFSELGREILLRHLAGERISMALDQAGADALRRRKPPGDN